MNLENYCDQLEQQLGRLPQEKRLPLAAKALQSAFKLQEDEVAIFSYEPRMEVFHFVWPTLLQATGVIPLKANNSLVSKTGRERKGYLDNHFSRTAHTFIFEFVQDKQNPSGHRPIQKIISAPLVTDGQLRGVIQASRKGLPGEEVGNDFRKTELEALEQICAVLARLL